MFPLPPRLTQKLIGGYAGAGQGLCGFPRTHCEDEIVCTKFAKALDDVCTLCYNESVKRTGQKAITERSYYMDKKFARYMGYGKRVAGRDGTVYKLIEEAEDKDAVKAVREDNLKRYDLLTAWVQNWDSNSCGFRERFTGDIEDCRKERESYEEAVSVAEVIPCDKVRFINPDYQKKFEVDNFADVLVNGEKRTVAYIDDYHFQFIGGCVYHICQFAELCSMNGIEVSKL